MNAPFHALVIGDEPDLRELLHVHLGRPGCRVSGAQTGWRGGEQAVADPPDVVVLDIMPPDIDGRDVARRPRADARTARCPIVLCTVLDRDDPADVPAGAVSPEQFGKAGVARMARQFTTADRGRP